MNADALRLRIYVNPCCDAPYCSLMEVDLDSDKTMVSELDPPGCAMQGHPLYSSKAVRFTLSCGVQPKRFTGSVVKWDSLWTKHDQWVKGFETRTETFAMQQKDELQAFTFKEPILCVGGLLKVGAQAALYH